MNRSFEYISSNYGRLAAGLATLALMGGGAQPNVAYAEGGPNSQSHEQEIAGMEAGWHNLVGRARYFAQNLASRRSGVVAVSGANSTPSGGEAQTLEITSDAYDARTHTAQVTVVDVYTPDTSSYDSTVAPGSYFQVAEYTAPAKHKPQDILEFDRVVARYSHSPKSSEYVFQETKQMTGEWQVGASYSQNTKIGPASLAYQFESDPSAHSEGLIGANGTLVNKLANQADRVQGAAYSNIYLGHLVMIRDDTPLPHGRG